MRMRGRMEYTPRSPARAPARGKPAQGRAFPFRRPPPRLCSASGMSMALDIPAAAARLRIPLSRLFAAATVAFFVALPTPWPAYGAVAAPIVDKASSLLGFALVTTATLRRLWSLAFISGHKNASLVQDGPYSCTRNPLYFFSAIGALGLGIT